MAAVGNLNDYVKFQMAQGMEKGNSSGGMAAELAVGLSIAQQIMQAGGPDLLSPADAARALGVPESDVIAVIESGEMAAKKIGTSYRIRRADFQAYLAR
jgi:excisionase family DNA binding protein